MRMRRFVADDMNKALSMIKKELGSEAIVLESKEVKVPQQGNSPPKSQVEVLAALDEKDIATSIPKSPPRRRTVARSDPDLYYLQEEMREMKELMQKVMTQLDHSDGAGIPQVGKELYFQLVSHGVNRQLARKLVLANTEKYSDLGEIREGIYRDILKYLVYRPPIRDRKPKIIAIVGPTGVGKTTTIAKMVSHVRLRNRSTVGIISADNFRIAASQQLETFAEIIHVPVISVYSPEEMTEAVNSLDAMDYIFIDTTGRSPADGKNIRNIAEYLHKVPATEIHLALEISSGEYHLNFIQEQFSVIPYTHLLFTKLDENWQWGNILNAQFRYKKPILYVTTGQNVPQDIEKYNPERIAKRYLEFKQ